MRMCTTLMCLAGTELVLVSSTLLIASLPAVV